MGSDAHPMQPFGLLADTLCRRRRDAMGIHPPLRGRASQHVFVGTASGARARSRRMSMPPMSGRVFAEDLRKVFVTL